jgi:hypothetical protein
MVSNLYGIKLISDLDVLNRDGGLQGYRVIVR